jgi:hypothetical protein
MRYPEHGGSSAEGNAYSTNDEAVTLELVSGSIFVEGERASVMDAETSSA